MSASVKVEVDIEPGKSDGSKQFQMTNNLPHPVKVVITLIEGGCHISFQPIDTNPEPTK